MPLMSEHMQPKGCNAAEIGHEVRPVQFMEPKRELAGCDYGCRSLFSDEAVCHLSANMGLSSPAPSNVQGNFPKLWNAEIAPIRTYLKLGLYICLKESH